MFNYPEKQVHWFWNKRWFGYKFHFFRGAFAWELQIGTHVWQKFYAEYHGVKFRHWIDEYGKEAR